MDENLLRYKFPTFKYLVIDTETCDLRLFGLGNYPWAIAYLVCEGDKIIEQNDYLLKWPNLKVSKDAAQITRFDPKIIDEHGLDPRFILEDIIKKLNNTDYNIVGQNILNFDCYILHHAAKELGLSLDYKWLERLLDTNCIARGWKNNQKPKENESLLAWQFRMNELRVKGIKTSNKALAKEFSLPYDEDEAHRALFDVNLSKKIFKELIWKIEI